MSRATHLRFCFRWSMKNAGGRVFVFPWSFPSRTSQCFCIPLRRRRLLGKLPTKDLFLSSDFGRRGIHIRDNSRAHLRISTLSFRRAYSRRNESHLDLRRQSNQGHLCGGGDGSDGSWWPWRWWTRIRIAHVDSDWGLQSEMITQIQLEGIQACARRRHMHMHRHRR